MLLIRLRNARVRHGEKYPGLISFLTPNDWFSCNQPGIFAKIGVDAGCMRIQYFSCQLHYCILFNLEIARVGGNTETSIDKLLMHDQIYIQAAYMIYMTW